MNRNLLSVCTHSCVTDKLRSRCDIITIFFLVLTEEDPLTSCQLQYQESWRNQVKGRAVPVCMPDGSYSKVQCYLSTCYCVDENGNQIRGTSVNALRDGIPSCDDSG